jgi:2-polyprenyl-3-methyl-5-hydroxy-6-metoxy-1,4-benzoquinol methylase
VITCFHVFEHFYEPHKILKKVWSWLKPGGIFYSMVPNIDSAGFRVFGSYWFALELPRHLFHFSPASIRHLAKSNDFEEVFINTYREMFIEESVRYMYEDIFRKMGFSPTTLAKAVEPSFPIKVVRKLVRMGIYAPLNSMARLLVTAKAFILF